MSTPGIEILDPETFDPGLLDTGERELLSDRALMDAGEAKDEAEAEDEAVPATITERVPDSEPPAPGKAELSMAWDDEDEDEDEDDKEEDDPHIGTTIGERYIVDRRIGEGGMGRVYLAHHKVIGKNVAIKILHAELARDKEAVGRFVREAKAASSIGNPHIVDISDFGELNDGSTYFVMEYLDGLTLGGSIEERGTLPPKMVTDVALQLCDGLAAAHKQGIIHRDLKPDNVTLVTQGTNKHFCKILDFGIAKVSSSASSTKLTMAGAVFGTPHYMSPEQAAGATVDHRTDIYSLGVMLYEMTSGSLPFNADNFMGILTQHMYKAPVPIRALVNSPDCPPGLEAIILKSLSKKPEARYQDFDEFADDLRLLRDGDIPHAVHDMMARSGSFNVPADYFKAGGSVAPPKGPQVRPRWGPRIVAIAGVAVAVAVVLFVLIKDSTTTAQPPETTPANATNLSPTTELPAPQENEVLLGSNPANAVALLNDEKIMLPSIIKVPEGEKVTVQVYAKDHEQQAIVLDGNNKRVVVTLVPIAGAAPNDSASASPAAPRPVYRPRKKTKKKTTPRPATKKKKGGDVVDPWAG
jgi:serine/threonine protein kinase